MLVVGGKHKTFRNGAHGGNHIGGDDIVVVLDVVVNILDGGVEYRTKIRRRCLLVQFLGLPQTYHVFQIKRQRTVNERIERGR